MRNVDLRRCSLWRCLTFRMKDDGFFALDAAAKITLATRKWRLPNSPSSFDDFLINERTLRGEIFIAVTQRAWTIPFDYVQHFRKA